MSEKYYSDNSREEVYPLSWWKDEAGDKGEPIRIELEKRNIGGDMWCKLEGEFISSGDGVCGRKVCPDYKPCNGISGRCRYLTNTFEGTGTFYTVYPDGKVTK